MPSKKPPGERPAKAKKAASDEGELKQQTEQGQRSALDFFPAKMTMKNLREAAADCRGCDLYKDATQTVFGEGGKHPRIMFIGEQPGDQEDKAGHPFVGPAGKLLDKAVAEAGINKDLLYYTNAVKHFKYEWRGKRRLHAKPRRMEVLACIPWLEAEIQQVKPHIIVCLGATAAQALFGPKFRLTQHRGEFLDSGLAPRVMATVHPSAILRAADDETRHAEMDRFVADMKLIARTLEDDRPD